MKKRPAPLPGQALCVTCEAPLFWAGNGRRPEKCDACGNNKPRRKPGTKLVPLMTARSPKAEAERRRTHGGAGDLTELQVLMLAVAMGIVPDAREAAKLAGVSVTGAELDAMIDRASGAAYEQFRTAHPTAITSVLTRAQVINALSLLRDIGKVAPANRALVGHMLQKNIDALGGHKLSWPVVQVTYVIEESK